MNNAVYEFVTPSDAVTFLASDDHIACVSAGLVSTSAFVNKFVDEQKAEYTGVSFPFNDNAVEEFEKAAGQSISDFIESHKEEVALCLSTFAYTWISDRADFDKKVSAIGDPEKLAAFKKKHEDERRTSMSRIVQRAWVLAKGLNEREVANA